MHLVAFRTEPASIRAILTHLGEPTSPLPLATRARDPPEIEPAASFAFDQVAP